MSQLRFVPCRIDAWTYQGDFLPQADRAALKRRVAHNLLAALPGLNLVAQDDSATPDRAILRQVQDEHLAWRRGWALSGQAGNEAFTLALATCAEKDDPELRQSAAIPRAGRLPGEPGPCAPYLTVEKSKFAGRSKMVRCKEAKKSRARNVLRIHKRSGFFR